MDRWKGRWIIGGGDGVNGVRRGGRGRRIGGGNGGRRRRKSKKRKRRWWREIGGA